MNKKTKKNYKLKEIYWNCTKNRNEFFYKKVKENGKLKNRNKKQKKRQKAIKSIEKLKICEQKKFEQNI